MLSEVGIPVGSDWTVNSTELSPTEELWPILTVARSPLRTLPYQIWLLSPELANCTDYDLPDH